MIIEMMRCWCVCVMRLFVMMEHLSSGCNSDSGHSHNVHIGWRMVMMITCRIIRIAVAVVVVIIISVGAVG